MIREICDVCKKNNADKRFKVKRSVRAYEYYNNRKLAYFWTPYEKIAICDECAEKLFNIAKSNTCPGHKKG